MLDWVKILHVADFLPGLHRSAGGAEFATLRTIEEQSRAGLQVEVVTLPADSIRGDGPWQRRYEMRHLDRYAPRAAFVIKNFFLPVDPLAASGLRGVIRESRPDVVHYHNLHYSGLSVVAEARAAGLPSVLTIYDYWIFCPSFMLLRSDGALCTRGHGRHCADCIGRHRLPALKPLKSLAFGARPRAFAPAQAAVDRFVVLSQASADLLAGQGVDRDRIAVVPQHAWQEALGDARVIEPVPGRLLYVGWIEPRKGLHVVLEALAQIADALPTVHLEVLGMAADARYRTELEAFVRERRLTGRVLFREKVGRGALLDELRRAWLVAVPEQWQNMSPVIVTEAMAAGACVLASRVGGIPQFVHEGVHGLLAARDDPAEWAAQIHWSMDHAQDILRMRRAARARATEVFDSADILRRTLDLYRSLAPRPAFRERQGAGHRV